MSDFNTYVFPYTTRIHLVYFKFFKKDLIYFGGGKRESMYAHTQRGGGGETS